MGQIMLVWDTRILLQEYSEEKKMSGGGYMGPTSKPGETNVRLSHSPLLLLLSIFPRTRLVDFRNFT